MCFSAGASFGTSAALASIGIAAIRKAGKGPQRLFAAIPLIFSAQQLTEGFVWLFLMHSSYLARQSLSVYCYMFFAYAVWPVWVPLSILLLETLEKRKKILRVLLITGAVTAVYIICCMLLYSVHAVIYNHHIVYTINYSHATNSLATLRDGFYCCNAACGFYINPQKNMGVWHCAYCILPGFQNIFFKMLLFQYGVILLLL